MISRVAESCFWLSRYLERADAIARLLRVNRAFVPDGRLEVDERWRPVIVVAGEEERFVSAHGEHALNNDERVQDALTWDRGCPVSIISSVHWARENARTIREVLSQDAFRVINRLWQWLEDDGRRIYKRDRDRFYDEVQQSVATWIGLTHGSMPRDETYAFMTSGMYLERAGQTARIIDVKHHLLERRDGDVTIESAHFMTMLRTCSASEACLRRSGGKLSPEVAVRFLLFDAAFPRSVLYSLRAARVRLSRIVDNADGDSDALEQLAEVTAQFERLRDSQDRDLHAELTEIIDATADICASVHRTFFDPQIPSQDGAQQA